MSADCLEQTCVQFPPVDLTEEGLSPELVTRAVLEAEPLFRFFHQQTLTDGPGLLAELLRIYDWIVQDALLHHLILHLREQQRFFFYNSSLKPANQVGPAYLRTCTCTRNYSQVSVTRPAASQYSSAGCSHKISEEKD